MATLYDMELQESNNFIHALADNGIIPALKLMEDQVKQAESMGEVGKTLVAQLNDPNTEMGKGYVRLKQLQTDIAEAMTKVAMTAKLAQDANTVFSSNPESLTNLTDTDQKTIRDYWLRKKAIIVLLLKQGYTHQELFS